MTAGARYRIKDPTGNLTLENASVPIIEYWGDCVNPAAIIRVTPINTQKHVFSSYEEMWDNVTPDFSKIMSQGGIVNSGMRQVKRVRKCGSNIYDADQTYTEVIDCSGTSQSVWRGSKAYGPLSMDEQFFLADPTFNLQNLIDRAVTKAWANADSSKAAALATLGEGKKTIRSVTDILGRLVKIIKKLKHLEFSFTGVSDWKWRLGNVGKTFKGDFSAKVAADRYMEARYAIRPLIYDMNSVINALSHKKSDSVRQTFRGFSSDSKSVSSQTTVNINSELHFSDKRTTFVQVNVRAGVLCQVDEPHWITLWGLDQLPEAAWELAPFSFIVDWFFNVGDTISSWVPRTNLRAIASWYVIETITYRLIEYPNFWFTPIAGRNYINPHFILGDFWRSETRTEKERVPDPRRSVLPSFDLRLDILKLIDLMIIARQIWSRR